MLISLDITESKRKETANQCTAYIQRVAVEVLFHLQFLLLILGDAISFVVHNLNLQPLCMVCE